MKLMKTSVPAVALAALFFPLHSVLGQDWVQTSAPSNTWNSIASSADGTHLVAVAGNGDIYTSTDAGTNWTRQTNAPVSNWAVAASSADGTHLVAAGGGPTPGPIYTSADSGATWTSNDAPVLIWSSVASSADGTHLAATAYSDVAANPGAIYLSSDAGAHWKQASAPSNYWYSITSSANGAKLAAVVFDGGIWTSTDFGSNWTVQAGASVQSWETIASSADGAKLVAAVYGGGVWTSTDSGTNWTQSATAPDTVYWASVASSADGRELAVVGIEDEFYDAVPPYVSTDSGTNWTATTGATNEFNWYSIASSADGSKLAAVVNSGYIYTLQSTSAPPVTPTLSIAVSGTNLVFSWPASATGFVLQRNPDVATTNWADVAASPIVTNGLYQVILPLSQGDNYFYRLASQSSLVSSPVLSIARSGGKVVVSWPAAATGFELQENSNLATANWAAVTNSVVVTNGLNQVTLTPSSGGEFYRLQSQP